MKHPQKKKAENRPRKPPIVPLDDAERSLRSSNEYQKSELHLAEAVVLADFGKAPNACVHSAYYAMYHAAAASLYAAGGVGPRKSVPESHEHVIQHFGKLVAREKGPLGECGMLLSQARTDRMTVDYGLIESVPLDEAQATVADAKLFVDECKKRWQLNKGALAARRAEMKDLLRNRQSGDG